MDQRDSRLQVASSQPIRGQLVDLKLQDIRRANHGVRSTSARSVEDWDIGNLLAKKMFLTKVNLKQVQATIKGGYTNYIYFFFTMDHIQLNLLLCCRPRTSNTTKATKTSKATKRTAPRGKKATIQPTSTPPRDPTLVVPSSSPLTRSRKRLLEANNCEAP